MRGRRRLSRRLRRWSCKLSREVKRGETFSRYSNLKEIHIPANVKRIGEGAFEDCPNLTVYAPAGSYAEMYVRLNPTRFVAERVF